MGTEITNSHPQILRVDKPEPTFRGPKLKALDPGREIAENLAIATPENFQESKVTEILGGLKNLASNVGAKVFKVTGFISASLAAFAYFVINIKAVAIFFAIPTILSFWLANNCSQSVKNSTHSFSTNPLGIIKKAKESADCFLESTNNRKLIQAIEDPKISKLNDEQKVDLIEDLRLLKEKAIFEVARLETGSRMKSRNLMYLIEVLDTTIAELQTALDLTKMQ